MFNPVSKNKKEKDKKKTEQDVQIDQFAKTDIENEIREPFQELPSSNTVKLTVIKNSVQQVALEHSLHWPSRNSNNKWESRAVH